MNNKKTSIIVSMLVLIVLNFSVDASAATKSVNFYRGSWLLWGQTNVTWTYSGGNISNSSANQTCGAIAPNTISKQGVSKYIYSSSHRRYLTTFRIGAGVPTPWGNANIYSSDQTDAIHIYGNGNFSW